MPYHYSTLFDSTRVILFHKQSTSAMTRFFRFNAGGVLVGGALPDLSRVIPPEPKREGAVVAHPGALAAEIEHLLELEAGGLELEAEFDEYIEVPGDVIRVYLMRFTTIDPPFMHAEHAGASFITLTQSRDLPQVELELLRSAYGVIMEG